MIEKPQWNAALLVEVLDAQTIAIVSERDADILSGRLFAQLAPLLDGTRSFTDLTADVSGISPPDVMYGLFLLAEKGYILEGGNGISRATMAYWNAQRVDAPTLAAQLSSVRVAPHRLGALDELVSARRLEEALRGAGVAVDVDAAFSVVVVDDYLNPALDALNRQMRADGRTWMLAKPVGTVVWIGPVFTPDGACWECLAQRLRSNRQMEAYLTARSGRSDAGLSFAGTDASVALSLAAIAAEAMKQALGSDGARLREGLVTLDALSLQTQHHALARRPQCPSCGDPSVGEAAPITLESRVKQFSADGGHRAVRPEETYRRLLPHLSPITGVISELRDLTDQAWAGIAHSYAASHNFALYNLDVTALMQNIRGRSGGKGATDIQARVSGMSEAIERYSGVYRGTEPRGRAAMAALGAAAVNPSDLLLFSDAQYADRTAWNARHPSTYHRVPERFDPSWTLDWSPVWSLTHEAQRYVPTAYCYYGHPDLREHFFCAADANGCAAGNTLEEAILQGFMELVERDSVALWWYNRVQRPAVDLDTFDEPYFRTLRAFYAKLDRDIWVLDITSDLGIPAFAAVSRRLDRPVEDIVLGFGAHFDAKLAIMRALTEVNQFLPSISTRNPDGSTAYWFHDPEAIAWWQTATLASDPYVGPHGPSRTADAYHERSSPDLKVDVETCVAIAREHGLDVLVLDQTQPDIGLPVVKVMVPGMRHFWKRFGPGRLFDVPVRLGWRAEAAREIELNPVGIFF